MISPNSKWQQLTARLGNVQTHKNRTPNACQLHSKIAGKKKKNADGKCIPDKEVTRESARIERKEDGLDDVMEAVVTKQGMRTRDKDRIYELGQLTLIGRS